MRIDALVEDLPAFRVRLSAAKADVEPRTFSWYPYETLQNVLHLSRLLSEGHRDLSQLVGGHRVADIGGADGEIAFFLERHGFDVDLIDWPPTNYNGMRGARALKEALRSRVRLFEVDLDAQFRLPDEHYGLAIVLGLLYHLKNPFFALEALARRAEWCLLSTRVARRTPDKGVELTGQPLVYLLDPTELNCDPTNYWIFSEAALRRLLSRTGWEVCDLIALGNTIDSDPVHPEADERVFCLARSRARMERPA